MPTEVQQVLNIAGCLVNLCSKALTISQLPTSNQLAVLAVVLLCQIVLLLVSVPSSRLEQALRLQLKAVCQVVPLAAGARGSTQARVQANLTRSL